MKKPLRTAARRAPSPCRCFLLATSLSFILKTLVFIERYVGEWRRHAGIRDGNRSEGAHDRVRMHATIARCWCQHFERVGRLETTAARLT